MIKKSKVIFSIFSVILFFGSNVANADIIVDPTDSQGWFAKGGNTGEGSLSATSPAGNPKAPGALKLYTDGSDGQIIQAARIPVVNLDDITAVSWAFNSSTTNGNGIPLAKIEYFGVTRSGTLVAIPSAGYVANTWKTEDGMALMWWSTEDNGATIQSLADWQSELGGILVNYFSVGMGSTGGSFPETTAYADDVRLAGTRGNTAFDDTWNFEGEAPLPPELVAENVPTLSEWALIMMSMLLALGVFARQRKLR